MTRKDAEKLCGRCLCGAVAYALAPPTLGFSHCHCESCRRASGAAYVSWVWVPWTRFAFERHDGPTHRSPSR